MRPYAGHASRSRSAANSFPSAGGVTDAVPPVPVHASRPPGPGRGHVVDFLQLPHWPIFNIADSAVVSAAVLIGLLALRGVGVDGARATQHAAKHSSDEVQRHG